MKAKLPEPGFTRYAAFIRGINVGGHSVIPMADLRAIFASLGYRDVKTVLASGNVLFNAPGDDAASLSGRLSSELSRVLGRDVTVMVRTVEELRALVARYPPQESGVSAGARPLVTFIADGVRDNDFSVPPPCRGMAITTIADGMIVSVSYDQYGKDTSRAMGEIEKAFGRKVTTRTWDTIIKVLKAGDTT